MPDAGTKGTKLRICLALIFKGRTWKAWRDGHFGKGNTKDTGSRWVFTTVEVDGPICQSCLFLISATPLIPSGAEIAPPVVFFVFSPLSSPSWVRRSSYRVTVQRYDGVKPWRVHWEAHGGEGDKLNQNSPVISSLLALAQYHPFVQTTWTSRLDITYWFLH